MPDSPVYFFVRVIAVKEIVIFNDFVANVELEIDFCLKELHEAEILLPFI